MASVNQQPPPLSYENLKIIVTSTPKTGNTWLRQLLAAIYQLPVVELGFPFDPTAAEALGARWVMHQHYEPEPTLLEWAQQQRVVLVTTTRHPGDVLLSLYHHVRAFNSQFEYYQLAALAADDGSLSVPVQTIVQTIFPHTIGISVDWLRSGASHMVQYEALYFEPVATLTELTNAIIPVSLDCIERVIEQCDIGSMRALARENSAFFRQGGCGQWRHKLTPEIIDIFRTMAPYPEQFAALGYSLGAQDAWAHAQPQRPPAKAAFLERFGHSPSMTALLKTIYLSFDTEEAARRWPDAASAAAPTLFHRWLNLPAEDDPGAPSGAPLISNLAAWIHRMQIDARLGFPDLYGKDRRDFLFWLLVRGVASFQLDEDSIAPLRRAFMQAVDAEWAAQPDPADPLLHAARATVRPLSAPLLSNLAVYAYQQRADLRAVFRDLYGQHRIEILRWCIEHLSGEYGLDAAYTTPLRQAFVEWATQPDAHDPISAAGAADLPALTNMVAYIYQQRPDLRAAFPDLYAEHRIDMLHWFVQHAAAEYHLDPDSITPVRQAFVAWAAQPDAADPAQLPATRAAMPVLTNIAVWLYRRRADLRAAYPDLYGRSRIAFVLWFLERAADEHALDARCIAPLRQRFMEWAMAAPRGWHMAYLRPAALSLYVLRQKQLNHRLAPSLAWAIGWLRAFV